MRAGEGGAGSDPDIWASAGALAWGVQCKETLKKVRDECKEILEAPLAVRKPLDKTLRKCVNSISATKQQVVQVYQRLSAALAAEQGPRQAYCLVRVCQLLVAQGEDLERQHQLAFPVGEVVAALGKDHPAVLSIFVGLLHEKASLAKRLQEVGCATVMPLGAPIGSNCGMQTRDQIRIILDQATVPVVVDAGLGVPSHAAEAMELGADAVLVNTAIAVNDNPCRMARAFAKAVEAGRMAYEIGLCRTSREAKATSPLTAFLNE